MSHHQQTSYPTTSRVKPRCRIRIELKQRGGQKSCKEDGGSDIVGDMMKDKPKRRRKSK
jgi:hypothetical protein